jgi:hypothetical protein
MWVMEMDVVFLIVCVSFVANERAVRRCGVEDYRAYSAVQCISVGFSAVPLLTRLS